jgi:hypothetical protein
MPKPALPKQLYKGVKLQMRFTAEELEVLKQRAIETGSKSLSEYVRRCINFAYRSNHNMF